MYKNDKDEKLLQLADLIVNTCGHIFCENKKDDNRIDYFNIIRQHMRINYFPKRDDNLKIAELNNDDNNEDIKVINCAFNSIKNFKEKYNSSKELLIKSALHTIDYLCEEFETDNNRVIKTEELVLHLNDVLCTKYKKDGIRKIIQKLRDNGVLIVSPLSDCGYMTDDIDENRSQKPSRSGGYKIPNTINDIKKHYNRCIVQIEPIIKRVNIMNTNISTYTQGQLSILNSCEEFKKLKSYVGLSSQEDSGI